LRTYAAFVRGTCGACTFIVLKAVITIVTPRFHASAAVPAQAVYAPADTCAGALSDLIAIVTRKVAQRLSASSAYVALSVTAFAIYQARTFRAVSACIMLACLFQTSAAFRTDAVIAFIPRAWTFIATVAIVAYLFQTSAAVQAAAVGTAVNCHAGTSSSLLTIGAFHIACRLHTTVAVYAYPVAAFADAVARVACTVRAVASAEHL